MGQGDWSLQGCGKEGHHEGSEMSCSGELSFCVDAWFRVVREGFGSLGFYGRKGRLCILKCVILKGVRTTIGKTPR